MRVFLRPQWVFGVEMQGLTRTRWVPQSAFFIEPIFWTRLVVLKFGSTSTSTVHLKLYLYNVRVYQRYTTQFPNLSPNFVGKFDRHTATCTLPPSPTHNHIHTPTHPQTPSHTCTRKHSTKLDAKEKDDNIYQY